MRSEPTGVATAFVDADNTLWDTDSVYAAAQLGLLSDVERLVGTATDSNDRLAFIRALDQDLAERHHSGLRYPAHLLTHALALALRDEPASNAVRRALKDLDHGGALDAGAAELVVTNFYNALRAVPPLRTGVQAGLQRLNAMGCLVIVVTEGARPRITATAQALGVDAAIDRIVEAPKQPRLYRRVARLSRAPEPMFMIGDQLQRDIAPAKVAGLETIYFPGNFAPKWEPSEDLVRPDHRIDDFQRVADIVAQRVAAGNNAPLAASGRRGVETSA